MAAQYHLNSLTELIANGDLKGVTLEFKYAGYNWKAKNFGVDMLGVYCDYGINEPHLRHFHLCTTADAFAAEIYRKALEFKGRDRNLF